jgi:hypothetical protein
MAVNVRIPGVGLVSADNAATESTLRALLQAMTTQQGRARRADSEIAAASRQQAGYADRAADSLSQVAANAKTSEGATRSLFSNLSQNINRVSMAGSDIKDSGAATYLKQLGATAVEVSALWAKNFGELPNNPVKAAQGLLNTGVDAISTAVAGIAKTILPIPDKLIDPASKVIKSGMQITVGMLSNEVNSTIKAYSTFNKMGASFADAMTGIRDISFQAGLTTDQFAAAMSKAEPSLKAMGFTTAGAVDIVGQIAGEFGQDNGKLRKQLMGLGYSVEEQTELAAQYLAQQRATMTFEQFQQYTDRRNAAAVAQETRQYAEDLKVLRDITGQDAKAAKERARVEVQRSGLLNKLGPDQKKAFEESFAVMNKLPANIQNALINRIMGQPITDPTIAMSEELMGMVENIAQGVLSGQKGMQKTTALEIASTQQRVKELGAAGQGLYALGDQLSALNVSGITADFAKTINAFILDPMQRDQIEKSYANAAKNAALTDQFTSDIVKFQLSVQNYAVEMSQALSPFLKSYTDALTQVTEAMNQFVIRTTQLLTGTAPPPGAPPGSPATRPYTPEDYINDMSKMYVKYLEPLFIRLDKLLPGNARGGIASGPTSGYLSLLHGTEAVIPLPDGKSVPVDFGATGIPNLANAVQQMQSSFTAVAAAKTTQLPSQEYKPMLVKEQIQELPAALSTALETVLSGPSGLVQTMSQVKNQIADDNKMQISMMQEQIDSLSKLVDAMQDNVRYSERLANELA